MAKIKVTLVKSTIGEVAEVKATVAALGLRKIRSSDLLCAGQIVIKHSCSTSLSFSVRSSHLGVAMCVIAPQIRLDSLLMPRIRTVTREPLGGRPRLG